MNYYTQKHGRGWAVIDKREYRHACPWDYSGLVCITLYKKGADEVVRRLNENGQETESILGEEADKKLSGLRTQNAVC